LSSETSLWGTPLASERQTTPRQVDHGIRLANQADSWPTPNAPDGRRESDQHSTQGGNLLREASLWATPDCNTASYSNGQRGANIREQANNWPTPLNRDCQSGAVSESTATKNSRPLREVVPYSHPDQSPDGNPSRNTSGRRLNPAFVCWLMGIPWFWTRAEPINFAAAETESFRSLLQSRLSNLCNAS